MANNVTISAGASETVYGVNNAAYVYGTETVASGGVDSGTYVYSGGSETVSSGGLAINTFNQGAYSYGSGNGSVLINNGGKELVSAGTAYDVTVNSGGTELVSSGGTTYYTIINSGGVEQITSGGAVYYTTLNSVSEVVGNGITATNTTLNSGGSEIVSSGGVANGAKLNGGGSEIVYSGGVVNGATINSAGSEIVSSGGVATNVNIAVGASETVYGVNNAAYIYGTETVASGGVDSGTYVYSGGSETVTSGGLAINTFNQGAYYYGSGSVLINNGGKELVSAGQAYDVSVNSGGTELVSSGGTAYYSIINSGGTEQIASSGVSYYTAINSGSNELISKGGVANNDTVYSGGTETIASGGIAYYPVNSGGKEIVLSGGELVVNNTTTGISLNGGAILDLPGVVATAGSVNASNQLVLTSGGSVVETLGLVGDNSNFSFSTKTDGSGGTLVTVAVIPPTLTKAVYNAANGQLSLTGTHLTSLVSNFIVTDLTLKGDGATAYTLTSGSVVSGTPSNSGAVIQLSAADQLAINGLLNKIGTQANDGLTNYNLSAIAGWDAYAGAITTLPITVSNVTAPTISSVSYNAATGVFSVTGANLDNHGSANGINLPGLTFSGGSGTYTFSATNDSVSNLSATGFTITLSAADKTSINSFITDNGTAPVSGAAYNLAATVNWDSDSGAKIITQPVTVSGLPTALTGVAYNAGTGVLTLSGHNLATTAAGYLVSDLTLKGDGNTSYTLTGGSVVSGTPASNGTGVSIQLSTVDQLAINGLLNKAGTQANDGVTTYNLSAISGWDTGAAAVTTQGVTVGNVTAPTISSVAYNAATGVFTVTGANLDNHGSSNGINLPGLTLTGGSGTYTFSATTDSVSNLSATGFTLTLSSADQALVNAFVTDNGTAPANGAVYNLAAALNWDSDSGAKITTQAVTVSGLSPSLSGVSYNAGSGILTLSGHNLATTAAGYVVSDLTLKGDGNTSYTLTGGSVVSGTPAGNGTGVSIQLSTVDQLAINGLLNKAGTQANDGVTTYNLSAISGWDTGAAAVTTQSVTVGNVTAPTISGVAYNAATGVFTVTGANLDNHGSSNGINLPGLTLTGGSGTYTFSATNDSVSNLSATGFTLTLSSADKTSVNSFVNANGTAPTSGKAYNLAASVNWDSDSGAQITTQSVTVSGLSSSLPTLSQVAYNAGTGVLSLSGTNFTTTAAGYVVGDLTLKGDGNTSYTLTSGSVVKGTPTATGVSIQLSAADQLAINGLLNKAGTQANDSISNYSLTATSGWDTGAGATNLGVTVSNVTAPTISSVAYNATTGVLTVTGANLDNHGSANGIALGNLTLSAGISSYTFSAANDTISNLTATGFKISLSSADEAVVNNFVTTNGTSTTGGAVYNLAATANWDSDSGAAITTQGVSVSGAALSVVNSGSFTNPQGVALDSAGNIYVTDFAVNTIVKIAAGTYAASTFLNVNQPSGLVIDKAGNFYVSEYGNNTVQEFTAGSLAPTTIATGLNKPTGLSLDSAGNVYVVNSGNASLTEINHALYLPTATAVTPTPVNNLWENTGQIELSKALFTAFAGAGGVTAANFSNAAAAITPTDYLYYNATNGGLYYDANGSVSGPATEIAVIGLSSHPTALSAGDFTLIP